MAARRPEELRSLPEAARRDIPRAPDPQSLDFAIMGENCKLSLGHEDIRTTMKYLEIGNDEKRRAMTVLDEVYK